MHIKLTCRYCGTKFCGFQSQSGRRTVQGELETAISKYFGKNIKVVGAGRTDAGVHAEGQVVSFLLPQGESRSLNELICKVNDFLPKDISVTNAEIKEKFNAREGAKSKTYVYKCFFGPNDIKPNIDAMKKAAELFIGLHDFSNFCSDLAGRNPVRNILDLDIKEEKNEILFIVKGVSFLKKMVRMIVGALLDIGYGKLVLSDVEKMFGVKCNNRQINPAPAKGLTLLCVEY